MITLERLVEELHNILDVAIDDEDLDRINLLTITTEQIKIAMDNIEDTGDSQ